MPGDPEPMAETSGAMVVAPARVPRAELGIKDLPDDILRRVLSCLDAREAVQTCVLSKLWRNLWRDARRINALCRAFEIQNGDYDEHQHYMSLFKKFVSRLLMLRNPVPLDEFRLWYSIDGHRITADSAEPNIWIRHALLCEARSVEIFAWHDRLELNPALYTSEHLTSLLLYSVVLTNGFFSQLQNGCKALERLILQDCLINDIEIASQTLKFLFIGLDCWFEPRPYDPAHPPSLSLPNLIHLGFFKQYPYARIPLVKNMESLKTAYVDLLVFNGLPVDDTRQFLLGLSGVTKLEFCFACGQEGLMMGMDLQWCPKFNNLKFLSLSNWYLDANFYGLIAFLQKSPNLEHLTLNLKLKQHTEVPGALMGWPGHRPFTCEHLKTVQIICSKDDPAVHSLREFLLAGGISDGQIHIKHYNQLRSYLSQPLIVR